MTRFFQIFIVLCQISCHFANYGSCDLENHPYAVTIRVYGFQLCGATLIHPRWVLTAAHCTYSSIENFSKLSVVVSLESSDRFIKVGIQQIIISDYFDPKTLQNDVSLLFLDDDLPLNMKCGQIAGPNFTQSCDQVRIIGWKENRRKNQFHTMIPYCIDVLLENIDECKKLFYAELYQEMLCTSYGHEGEQPCRGDSGGPLLCRDVVIGIISFGADCQYQYRPSVFARVDTAIDFIKGAVEAQRYKLKAFITGKSTVYRVISGSGKTPNYTPILIILSVILVFN